MTERLQRPSRLPWIGAALVAGTALAGAAAWNRRQAERAERRAPATGRFIEVDGARLHYIEKGEGSAVVLLHGNGTQATDFVASGLFDLLARRHRVIAFDRPGFGYSARPNGRLWTPSAQATVLRAAFEVLDIDDAVVVGHSLGASVAMALAIESPEAVRGLVLLGGYFYPTPRIETLFGLQALPLVGPILSNTVVPLATRLLSRLMNRRMFSPHAVAPKFEALVPRGMRARPSQVGATAADGGMMVPAAFKMRRRYWEVMQPTTIFTGDADRVVDPGRQSMRLHREMAHSDLRILPRVGHMLHYAAGRKIAAVVAQYATPE
ncbi:MAG: alpha/beta fold hydrolase [Janthinobacterium lividum]